VEVAQTDLLNYQFKDTGHFQVDYIVINSFGCNDTASAEVFIFDEFEFIIPNIFSPNGDGINETFEMRACGVYEFEISIFNRSGEKVFKSNSMNINWDGRIGGKKASSGVYYYSILIKDFRGEYLDYSGSLTLIGE
jgi:gliding motility-associated-like protein